MDRCHRWDTRGHEAGVDEVDDVRWHIRWHVIGGVDVAAKGRIEGGVGVHEWGDCGKHGAFWAQLNMRWCGWCCMTG